MKTNFDASDIMMEVMEEKDSYLGAFARFDQATDPAWLRELRQQAIERFAELGFPTLTDEEWRFTNLAPLTQTVFQLGERIDRQTAARMLEDRVLDHGSGPRLVFVNGRFDPGLSRRGNSLVGIQNFAEVRGDRLERMLGQHARFDEHAFIALNTAFLRDGAFVEIPESHHANEPIHLVYLGTGGAAPSVGHPRALVVAGRNSRATVLESYAGPDGCQYFTNAVTEIVVGEDASIDHYKLQREGREAFHVATLQVHLGRSSRFRSQLVALGGSLMRNEINAVLDAPGGECTLNGLYLAGGSQHMDNRTFIDHAKPHCTSHELYKGVLDGRARGVFNGKIRVAQDAQKTDAKQTNKTLLLSDDAQINTKPQLEIYADDVKCTHGATVGQLSEEAIFYLRARGIDRKAAQALLTFAFANDIIGRIEIEAIRNRLEEMLLTMQHLPQDEHLGEKK